MKCEISSLEKKLKEVKIMRAQQTLVLTLSEGIMQFVVNVYMFKLLSRISTCLLRWNSRLHALRSHSNPFPMCKDKSISRTS